MTKVKPLFILALMLVLATGLFAGPASRVALSGSNDNRAMELKTQLMQLWLQGKNDAALLDEYRNLTTPSKPEKRRPVGYSLDQGGDVCATATVIGALPYTDSGTTVGYADDYDPYSLVSPDVAYSYTPVVDQTVDIDLCGSFSDNVVMLYADSCTGYPIAGNYGDCGLGLLGVSLSAGTTYYIVVDGIYAAGDYTLHVTARLTGRCCYSNNLQCVTATNVDCAVLGGVFTEGLTCADACPPPPPPCICGPMDLVFVIDTTGSMGGAIGSVVAELPNIIATANYFSCDLRIGLVTFGDQVVVDHQLTNNLAAVQASIATLAADGGSGIPECSDEALLEVINGTGTCVVNDWTSVFRPAATKIVVLVTDAPPAGCDDNFSLGVDDIQAHNVALAAQVASIRLAAVYVPTSSSNNSIIVPIMQDYANTTSGSYRITAANGAGTGAAINALVADCGQGILQLQATPPVLSCVRGRIQPNPANFYVIVSNTGNESCTGVTLTFGPGTGAGTGTITPSPVAISTLAAGQVDTVAVSAALNPNPTGGLLCFRADLSSDSCPPAFIDICFEAPLCEGCFPICEATTDPCHIPAGCFTTYTQGGWGQDRCHGNNVGCLRNTWFGTVFPTGLTIGGGFTLRLSNSAAVAALLPTGGTPGVFTQNYVNPTSTSAGVLTGQLVSVAIAVGFGDYGVPGFGDLGSLVIASGPFTGWTVDQLLATANAVIGGNLGALPAGVSVSNLNSALTAINEGYHGGTIASGYLVDPCCDLADRGIRPAEPRLNPGTTSTVSLTNRPNPFNPTTQISFELGEGGWTSLRVFNLLGQQVAELVNGALEAGQHNVSFDGSSLPSGLYVYRLEANGQMHQAKMLLLK